jgi:glycogen debranching enzyme
VIDRLLAAEFRSGWGVRTLAVGEARYNPMSYHNGSIWPHDTAMAAAGMARYGERAVVAEILGEVYAAAAHFKLRLPELFCGFPRQAGEPPIAYPVACLPQAWAAGSVFLMLQSALGIVIDAYDGVVEVDDPVLPPGLDRLTVSNLTVGDGALDLVFQRLDGHVAAAPRGRRGGLRMRTLR